LICHDPTIMDSEENFEKKKKLWFAAAAADY
jgi:hypothetical protein